MALLKRRPSVRVRVPREVRPGTEARVVVMLDCPRAIEVRAIDVLLEGTEAWQNGEAGAARQVLLRLAARLGETRTLPAGHTELPVTLPIPLDAPPSYRSQTARIEYELRVHVDIPWWPDRRASFELLVAPPEQPSPPTTPQLFSSNPNGPVDRESHVELSVASTWTRAGDIVSGALALSNVQHHRYAEVRVGLKAVESHIGPDGHLRRRMDGVSYQVQLGAGDAREGEMIPFRFRLPSSAPAGFSQSPRPNRRVGLLRVDWELELTVTVAWGRDLSVRVPFTVLPPSPRPDDAPERLAPPTVGSDRMRGMWEAVGEPRGLRYENQALFAHYGETSLLIRRDHAGRDGVHLTAELRFPPLHLRLAVEPAGSVQRILGGGAVSGARTFDDRHHATARDLEQASAFLATLAGPLAESRLRRFDDTTLIMAERETGQNRRRLTQFVDRAIALAEALEANRRRIPPPAALAPGLAVWEELAERLAGTLETARMQLDGTMMGATETSLRVELDERVPETTWLSVALPIPLDDARTMTHRPGDPEPPLSGEARELFRIVTDGARTLAVEPTRISVELEGLVGVPDERGDVRWTASAVEQRASRLARFAAVLRGASGPYR